MKVLNVVLPGLIWPEIADYEYLLPRLQTPKLAKMLNQAQIIPVNYSYSDFVYLAQGVSQPSLAHTWAERLGVRDFNNYLLVEPTHLRADRDRLLIAEAELLQLDATEAELIIEQINAHFDSELRLYFIRPELWLMGVNLDLADMRSLPIIDIVGENIDDYLPSGSVRLKLHQLLNEIQMLLFSLPLNVARQEEGSLPVNSVWLWDKEPLAKPLDLGQVLSSNSGLGTTLTNIEQQLPNCNTLIIDQAYFPSRYRDSYAWVAALNEWEQELIPELLKVLANRTFSALNLWVPGLENSYLFHYKPRDKWKFWKPADMATLLAGLIS